jgi:hypothetical protein
VSRLPEESKYARDSLDGKYLKRSPWENNGHGPYASVRPRLPRLIINQKNQNKMDEKERAVKTVVENWTEEQSKDAKEVIIRTGAAIPPAKPARSIDIIGAIGSAAEFYLKRVNDEVLHKKNDCHLLVDRYEEKIILVVDEREPNFETKITGALRRNKDLEEFEINTDKMWSTGELSKFLRLRRGLFADPEECTKMADKLANFTAKFTKEMEVADDRAGNTLLNVVTKLENSIPLTFKLNVPVFIGTKKSTFRVDVIVDATNSQLSFFLESTELKEQETAIRDTVIDEEVAKFSDIVCIEVI